MCAASPLPFHSFPLLAKRALQFSHFRRVHPMIAVHVLSGPNLILREPHADGGVSLVKIERQFCGCEPFGYSLACEALMPVLIDCAKAKNRVRSG
jgi:hypothetical protein